MRADTGGCRPLSGSARLEPSLAFPVGSLVARRRHSLASLRGGGEGQSLFPDDTHVRSPLLATTFTCVRARSVNRVRIWSCRAASGRGE